MAITSFASLIQDYISAKSWGSDLEMGRMVALVGDAELDEGYDCFDSADFQTGFRAFLDKSKPVFEGR